MNTNYAQNGSFTINVSDAVDYINGNTDVASYNAVAGDGCYTIECGSGSIDKLVVSFGDAIDISSATTVTFYAKNLTGWGGVSIKAAGSDATAGWDNKKWTPNGNEPWINAGADHDGYKTYVINVATLNEKIVANGGEALSSLGSLFLGCSAVGNAIISAEVVVA